MAHIGHKASNLEKTYEDGDEYVNFAEAVMDAFQSNQTLFRILLLTHDGLDYQVPYIVSDEYAFPEQCGGYSWECLLDLHDKAKENQTKLLAQDT